MARPKKDRPGKNLTLYLTAERLDRLGPDPAAAIYALIDGQPLDHEPRLPPAKKPRRPANPSRHACPRHARMGYLAPVNNCPDCPQ